MIAEKSFSKGDFLLEYAGKLLTAKEGERLEEQIPSNKRYFCFLSNKEFWYVFIIDIFNDVSKMCFISKKQMLNQFLIN